jgi:5-bromo-4-chloroindolyl phosphate hydrolysis protein
MLNRNLGDEIKNIVQDAVKNRDYGKLSNDIGRLVNGALDEVRQSFKNSRDSINRSFYNGHNYSEPAINRPIKRSYKTSKLLPTTVPVGRVSGILYTVFGLIGSSLSAVLITVMAMMGAMISQNEVFYVVAAGAVPCFISCMLLYLKGRSVRKRLQRFNLYISRLNGFNYCQIKDLASINGLSYKNTVKDLQRMIAVGMFPEGHIDDKKTCFMLNNESYQLYRQLQDNMKMKEVQEQVKVSEPQSSQNVQSSQNDNSSGVDIKPEIRKALNEGRQYIQEIKHANDVIPGEEISNKLDKLELVTGRIFDYVETHPDKYPEIRKFTEYFLPTTLKLVNAYKELDHQPVEGINIIKTKKEIENTLDTINVAFERLLDSLFEDVAMDVSTDITVLETMLAQEGLTANNVSK